MQNGMVASTGDLAQLASLNVQNGMVASPVTGQLASPNVQTGMVASIGDLEQLASPSVQNNAMNTTNSANLARSVAISVARQIV